MPPALRYSPAEPEEIYVPIVRDPSRGHGFLRVIGRLRPGVRLASAQSEMEIVTRRLSALYPKNNQFVGVNIVPLVTALAGPIRTGLLIFLGVVTIVLLIACTNVANLMLARYASRQKEMALRAALGAGRARLMQQLLTESTLLALVGGACGLLLASWGTRLLVALLAKNFSIPRIETTHADGWVLAFTLGISLATGVVFGIVPAVTAAAPDLNERLREASRTATAGTGGRRLRNTLVVTETALALVLLAGASLLVKGLLVMRATAPGFETDRMLTVDFTLPKTLDRVGFFESLLERVVTVPGVRSAAVVADLPLGGGHDSLSFQIPGRQPPPPRAYFSAAFNIVSPGYFRTMAIPVRLGREFIDQDAMNSPPVVVINETAARRFWPGEPAVGKQIVMPGPNKTSATLTVVGVTGDVRQIGLGTEPRPEMFLSYLQPGPGWPWLTLIVRATADPMTLAATIRSTARSVNRDVPLHRVRTMDEVLSGSLAEPRVYTWLMGVFAGLALALAAVGLYGVVSYTVAQRTHEMGIRIALGAHRAGVVRLVLRQGLGLTLIGTTIGLAGALGVMRLVAKLMPSVQPTDPLTLSGACALLIAVALSASLLPARRAARVDPIVALRDE
jgi:putative ABC transport system permease protein